MYVGKLSDRQSVLRRLYGTVLSRYEYAECSGSSLNDDSEGEHFSALTKKEEHTTEWYTRQTHQETHQTGETTGGLLRIGGFFRFGFAAFFFGLTASNPSTVLSKESGM